MATTTDLIRTLSDALGIEHKAINLCARFLREAGYLPTGRRARNGAAEVTVEHARHLLLAVMSGAPVTKAAEVLRIYRDLPLTCVRVQMCAVGATDEVHYLAPDDPLAAACPATFGELLDTFLETWPPKLPHGLMPTALYIAAEPGAHAWIDVNSVADRAGAPARGSLCYAVDPGTPGWTHLPGKARVAHLGRFAMVPAGIFEVLSDLVGGEGRGLVALQSRLDAA